MLAPLAKGHANLGIAKELSPSERTAGNHVFHSLAKLGLESRTAAVARAARNGVA